MPSSADLRPGRATAARNASRPSGGGSRSSSRTPAAPGSFLDRPVPVAVDQRLDRGQVQPVDVPDHSGVDDPAVRRAAVQGELGVDPVEADRARPQAADGGGIGLRVHGQHPACGVQQVADVGVAPAQVRGCDAVLLDA
ncbi:hypothetical protein [Streptacidiphilus sp. PAMC 29251]